MTSTESSFKRVLRRIILCCILFSGSSCSSKNLDSDKNSSQPLATTSMLSNRSSFAEKWLNSTPCTSPCIEGIVPGKTRPEEALTILKESPSVKDISQFNDKFIPSSSEINWKWVSDNLQSRAFYDISQKDPTIYTIYSIMSDTRLERIINSFGFPTYVIALPQRQPDMSIRYNIRLIYLEHGFILLNSSVEKPILNDQLIFNQIYLFEPTEEALKKTLMEMAHDLDILIRWSGFKNFDYYCRDEQGQTLCN